MVTREIAKRGLEDCPRQMAGIGIVSWVCLPLSGVFGLFGLSRFLLDGTNRIN